MSWSVWPSQRRLPDLGYVKLQAAVKGKVEIRVRVVGWATCRVTYEEGRLTIWSSRLVSNVSDRSGPEERLDSPMLLPSAASILSSSSQIPILGFLNRSVESPLPFAVAANARNGIPSSCEVVLLVNALTLGMSSSGRRD